MAMVPTMAALVCPINCLDKNCPRRIAYQRRTQATGSVQADKQIEREGTEEGRRVSMLLDRLVLHVVGDVTKPTTVYVGRWSSVDSYVVVEVLVQ